MKTLFLFALLTAGAIATPSSPALRVFIRGGVKSHGPNAHEHERFLHDWKKLLSERGMMADGAMDWPDEAQFAATDVVVLYAQEGGNATAVQKENLAKFTQRGGGLVVIHTAAVSNDTAWWKSAIGGAWVHDKTKWREGQMALHFPKQGVHAITKGAADFAMDDEIYYNLDLSPDIQVLATSDTGDGDPKIQPQMWTYETENHRAFVTLPGHWYGTFSRPNYRAILLRGICWAAKRDNLDEFCKPEEIKALAAPETGVEISE